MSQNLQPLDGRPHKSVVDEEHLEWLGDLSQSERAILNSFLFESDDLANDDLLAFCRRYIRLGTSVGGKRVNLMAGVAIHDEALRIIAETKMAPGTREGRSE